MKEKLLQIFNKLKKIDFKKIKNNNLLFLFTVLSFLFNGFLLRSFTVGNFFELKPIFGDLSIILLLCSLGYLFKYKSRFYYYVFLSVFTTAICVINSMYYTFYTSFASVSLIQTSFQIADVSDAVVQNVLQIKDFIYIWQPIALIIFYIKLNKKKYFEKIKKEKNKKKFVVAFTSSMIILAIFMSSLSSLEIGRLLKQWNREFLLAKMGVFIYQGNDIIRSLEPKINNIFGYDKAMLNVRTFYDEREVIKKENKYTNLFKDKNVIMIHAESIQTFLLDLKFNDLEVAPNFKRLSEEGMFFSNFYSQVSVGTSSDTEFTLSTGLLPVNNGTVSISYWDRSFESIQKALNEKDYYTFSMHGNNGTYWNRINLHNSLGYDRFYHKKSYTIDEKIGLGISDMSFFDQSATIIKDIDNDYDKFFGTLITLTNHTPFDQLEAYGEFPVNMTVEIENEFGEKELIVRDYMEDTTLGNYFKSVHYADKSLGHFMERLEEEGLLEDTIIVIYGDHDSRLSRKEYERLYNYDPYTDEILDKEDENYVDVDYYFYELNRKIPLIIWSKDKKLQKEITTVTGMYDVFPTLGNMLGIESKYALGQDVLSVNDNMVVFPNGNWITNKMYYNSQKEEYKLLVDEVISQAYVDERTEKSERYISVSNDLIIYDYLKYLEDKKEVGEIINEKN